MIELSRKEYLASSSFRDEGSSNLVEDEANLRKLDEEIADVDKQVTTLQSYLQSLKVKRLALSQNMAKAKSALYAARNDESPTQGDKCNYATSSFPWVHSMKDQMKRVFGIDNFRLCQEACVIIFSLSLSEIHLIRFELEYATLTWTGET